MLGHGRVVRCAVIAKNRFVNLFFGKGLPCVQGQILADGVLRAGQGSTLPSTAALRAVRSKATPPRTIRCAGVRFCRRRCAATRARSSATRNGLVR